MPANSFHAAELSCHGGGQRIEDPHQQLVSVGGQVGGIDTTANSNWPGDLLVLGSAGCLPSTTHGWLMHEHHHGRLPNRNNSRQFLAFGGEIAENSPAG